MRIALLCATRRGLSLLHKLRELRPEDEAAPALTMALLPPAPPKKLPGAEQALLIGVA